MNTKENLLLSEANNIHLRSTSFQDETILNRTTEENDTINLLNFDPRIKAHTFLTSPRSIEACKILGYNQEDLLMKSEEEFSKDIPSQFMNYRREYIEMKADHYEKTRQERVNRCISVREKIIEKQNGRNRSVSLQRQLEEESYSKEYSAGRSITVNNSPRKNELDKLRKKNEREIEIIKKSEQKSKELEEKLSLKILKIQAIKEEKARVLSARLTQREITATKKIAAIKEEEKQKTETLYSEVRNSAALREEKIRKQQMFLTQQRLSSSKEREIKRKMAIDKSINILKEQEKKNIALAEKKREEIEQKYKDSQNAILEKKKKKAEVSRIQRLIFEKKRIGKSIEKEKKAEERLKRYEEYRKIEQIYRKEQRDAKSQEIRLSIERRELEEIQRKSKKIDSIDKAQKNKEKILQELEKKRKEKMKEEEKKEHQVKMNKRLKLKDELQEAKNASLIDSLEQSFQRAEEKKSTLISERMKNHIMSHIREEEAKINLIRQERAKEYARVSLVDKTESKEKRLKSYAHERSLIKQEKNQMMIEFMREKDKIRQEFEQDKRKNPKSLSFDLEAKNLVPIKSITDRKISPKTNTSVKKVEIIDTPKKGEAHKKTASTAATSETSKEPKIPSHPKSARTASIDSPNVYKAGKNDQESNKELILEDEINKLRVARIQLDKEFLETLNKDMRREKDKKPSQPSTNEKIFKLAQFQEKEMIQMIINSDYLNLFKNVKRPSARKVLYSARK